jgi:hypothetical protein
VQEAEGVAGSAEGAAGSFGAGGRGRAGAGGAYQREGILKAPRACTKLRGRSAVPCMHMKTLLPAPAHCLLIPAAPSLPLRSRRCRRQS